ncbi:MAG TPA: hypothetical protein VIJ72_00055, partial [Rhizomicrobium sp.]
MALSQILVRNLRPIDSLAKGREKALKNGTCALPAIKLPKFARCCAARGSVIREGAVFMHKMKFIAAFFALL